MIYSYTHTHTLINACMHMHTHTHFDVSRQLMAKVEDSEYLEQVAIVLFS